MSGLPLPLGFPLGGSGTGALKRTDGFYFDLIGRIESCHLWASYDGGEDWEPIIVSGELDERMVYGGSSRRDIASGDYRWTLRRAGGWPSAAVQLDSYSRPLTILGGTTGPAITVSPVSGTELARTQALTVAVLPGTQTLQESSIAIWLSMDDGKRWESAVKKGALVSRASEAGSTKTPGGGGWTYVIRRFGGLYSALRARTLKIKARANDQNALMDGEVVP